MKRKSLTVKTVDGVKSIFFKSDTKNNFQGSKIRVADCKLFLMQQHFKCLAFSFISFQSLTLNSFSLTHTNDILESIRYSGLIELRFQKIAVFN